MKTDQLGTTNLNQKQASGRVANETDKQINPSVKYDPRQETSETSDQQERGSRGSSVSDVPKTVEKAPSVDSTVGGL